MEKRSGEEVRAVNEFDFRYENYPPFWGSQIRVSSAEMPTGKPGDEKIRSLWETFSKVFGLADDFPVVDLNAFPVETIPEVLGLNLEVPTGVTSVEELIDCYSKEGVSVEG